MAQFDADEEISFCFDNLAYKKIILKFANPRICYYTFIDWQEISGNINWLHLDNAHLDINWYKFPTLKKMGFGRQISWIFQI